MANLRNYTELQQISEIAGLELVTDSSHITLRKGMQSTPTWCVNYWTQGDVNELTDMVDLYSTGDVSWGELVHYEDSMRDSEGGYVVDSYRLGKELMMSIVESAFNDCGYSKELIAKIETLDFNHTSARLYKGRYVTPCMLSTCVKQVIEAMTSEQRDALEILTDCKSSKLIEKISDDAWNELGEDGTSQSLELLDLVRGV